MIEAAIRVAAEKSRSLRVPPGDSHPFGPPNFGPGCRSTSAGDPSKQRSAAPRACRYIRRLDTFFCDQEAEIMSIYFIPYRCFSLVCFRIACFLLFVVGEEDESRPLVAEGRFGKAADKTASPAPPDICFEGLADVDGNPWSKWGGEGD